MTAEQQLRDAGMALAEEAADDMQRATIDQAIGVFAASGRPFSANDIRPLLPPGIRPALVGARFLKASRGGRISPVGWAVSTDPGTHYKPVRRWIGSDPHDS